MNNKTKHTDTDAKPKMLFNSDGFNFLVKFVTVLFKIVGAIALVFVKIVFAFCETSTKKTSVEDNIDGIDNVNNFVPLNPLKTTEENEYDGTGYYK